MHEKTWLVIWWLVLSFEQLLRNHYLLPRFCEYVISAGHEPKNLNSPVCDWRVQKLLDPVRQSEFIEHLLMKKGARWLIMAYPSYSPSSSSNSPSSSAVASSHEEKRHVFCHIWGDPRSYAWLSIFGFRRLASKLDFIVSECMWLYSMIIMHSDVRQGTALYDHSHLYTTSLCT